MLKTKLLKEDVIYCIVFLIKIFHKENEAEGLGKLELFGFAANRSISNLWRVCLKSRTWPVGGLAAGGQVRLFFPQEQMKSFPQLTALVKRQHWEGLGWERPRGSSARWHYTESCRVNSSMSCQLAQVSKGQKPAACEVWFNGSPDIFSAGLLYHKVPQL